MADVLTDTLTITVGEDQFVFKIPTPIQQIEIGVRASALRRRFDASGAGWEDGLDTATYLLVRGMVILQVLLTQSSAKWPYTETRGADGKPIVAVDIDKFPPSASPIIIQVYQGFNDALARFFGGGVGDDKPAVSDAVAGEPNPA